MSNAPFVPAFSRSDIQLLVGGYSKVGFRQWGQIDVFSRVLGLGPMYDKSIAVVAWYLSELEGHVACVVDPFSDTPWYLRIVLMRDFVFLGLHWAGSDSPASLGDYDRFLVDALCNRPLVTGAMACHPLTNQAWCDLLCELATLLGSKVGNICYVPPSVPIIPAAAEPMPAAAATVPAAHVPAFNPALPSLPALPVLPPLLAAVPDVPAVPVAMASSSVAPAICTGDVQMEGEREGTPFPTAAQVREAALPQIVTRDGRVITPQWSATFPPPPSRR
ncbi:uncharacterized protein N7496_007808 [Penicillium cataractarum]|uniref:Uncharacterized protein n=1 Tax=Penicillium cataractarum TaxID=2100454 RepID=A0A9W9V3Z1_9EURO|nr:uncharacterized protein N7496_007808 [Penicillium cataractarum]KAJ5368048.1 hypothetical protein N7496_007808 [Penicillium cataractarum]